MQVCSKYPGSIGELIQGKLDHIDVLVSCPINLYTTVRLFETNKPFERYKYEKSSMFFKNMLNRWGYSTYLNTLDFQIHSDIPNEKGFASSTADLCALYSCLTTIFRKNYDEWELAEECTKVEPTDSIVFKKMTMFDYKNGTYKKTLGEYIKFYSLCFVGEKNIDTVEFNNKTLYPQKHIEDLIVLLEKGVSSSNYKNIFEASSQSIIRNQHRLKYDILPEVIRIREKTGGLGIIGAHSGNLLGIVYDERIRLNEAYKQLANHPLLKNHSVYALESITAW